MSERPYNSATQPCPAGKGELSCAELDKQLQYAAISDASYKDLKVGDKVGDFTVVGHPPPVNDPDTNFHAYTLVNSQGDAVVAFRGSAAPSPSDPNFNNDWVKTNAVNELGGIPEQYQQAADYGAAAKKEYGTVTLTGHSKGGGEGAYAALKTGSPAELFNAAPLGVGSRLTNLGSSAANIHNLNVTGDVLSNPVSGFSGPDLIRTVMAAVVAPFSPVAGALVMAAYSKQVGQRTFIPAANSNLGTIDKHAMSTVIGGLDKLKADKECP